MSRLLWLALVAACTPEAVDAPTTVESEAPFVVRAGGLSVRFDGSVTTLGGGAEPVALALTGWGREVLGPLAMVPARVVGARAERDHGAVLEWWADDAAGLEQGWDLLERPDGEGPVRLRVGIDGATARLAGDRLVLTGADATWRASAPVAWDADGDPVDAWFELEADAFTVVVDDTGADWPITVDPYWTTAWNDLYYSVTTAGMFGYAVAAGDLNGDSYDDLLVGEPLGGSAGAGQVHVYYGTGDGLGTSPDASLEASGSSGFGWSLAVADVTGDHLADVIVGAPSTGSSSTGAVYVFNGSATGVSATPSSTLTGTGTASANFGAAVSAGDINGDTRFDVVVGEYGAATYGRTWVFMGTTSGASTTTYRTFTGSVAGLRFGFSVSSGGDISNDGYDDLAVGAPSSNPSATGRAYVYSGASAFFYSSSTTATKTYTGTSGYQDGYSVLLAGSFNGDGYGDLVVGAPRGASTGIGRVYTYKSTGSSLASSSTTTFDCPVTTSACSFGAALAFVGDTNGSYDELLVGGWTQSSDDGLFALYDGAASTSLSLIDTGTRQYTAGAGAEGLGWALAGGDFNHDYIADIVVGAPFADASAGHVLVYAGGADADGDGYVVNDTAYSDCRDTDPTVNPGATEACDSVDNDCDGYIDESGATASTWYADTDGDSYGDAGAPTTGCTQPSGYVSNDTDCDDSAAATHPGATEVCDGANVDEDCDGAADEAGASGESWFYADADGDSHGDASTAWQGCDAPSGYVALADDCDDASASVHPGATEVCDPSDTDEDCDGTAEESGASGESVWYADTDGDRYGGPTTLLSCDQPSGYVADGTDCDDASASVHPGATEVCDPSDTDEDCDGTAEESGASGESVWYADTDGDRYGGPTTLVSCNQPSGFVSAGTDCDDSSSAVNPGATEVCDPSDTDEDCDGLVDDADGTAIGQRTSYADRDGDTYGDAATGVSACDIPASYVADATDCDDADAADHPGATEELGNGDDEDCDGAEACFVDGDRDGYRPDATSTVGSADTDCDDAGEALLALPEGDCDDADDAYHPGAAEACTDRSDYNCDGAVAYADNDSDGHVACEECDDGDAAVHPGAVEVAGDSVDQDCDGREVCWLDADDDGFLDGSGSTVSSSDVSCIDAGEGSDLDPIGDCDDTDPAVNPASAEVAGDGIDEDCDGADLVGDTGDTATDTGGDDDTGHPGDSAVGDDTSETGHVDSDVTGDKDTDSGCGCTSGARTDLAFGLLVGVAALSARRRRRGAFDIRA